MVFIICAVEGALDFKIDEQQFINQLSDNWPVTKLVRWEDLRYPYTIEWTQEINNVFVEGQLARTLNAITLEGDVKDCAEIALWFRRLVPLQTNLLFFDVDYTSSIEVKMNTILKEITDVNFY